MLKPMPVEDPVPDLGGNAGEVLSAMTRVYGDLQHALAAEREELMREVARRGKNPGPVEDRQLDLEIARRQALVQFMAKAIFDGYGSDGTIHPV
jgi:hypothetical protein